MARADDNHAPPVSAFPKVPLSFKRIHCMSSPDKEFYCWANVAAFNLTDNIIGCNASLSEDKACSLAMRLMFQILNWNFIQSSDTPSLSKFESSQYSPGIRHGATLLKKFERTLVQDFAIFLQSSNGDESSVSAEGKMLPNYSPALWSSQKRKFYLCGFVVTVAAETAYGEDDHAEYLLAAVSKDGEASLIRSSLLEANDEGKSVHLFNKLDAPLANEAFEEMTRFFAHVEPHGCLSHIVSRKL
ncbi:hypothetical protein HPP92_025353 [Vanilla planifolia]|uniref:Uncharacterized protein n=1 Tax=Vanilla planifolia TaxID=51239 RepID=A0A835PLS3_VANPL|nr:hypothetical protein HPP92_025353 [Vanilla planifolia]